MADRTRPRARRDCRSRQAPQPWARETSRARRSGHGRTDERRRGRPETAGSPQSARPGFGARRDSGLTPKQDRRRGGRKDDSVCDLYTNMSVPAISEGSQMMRGPPGSGGPRDLRAASSSIDVRAEGWLGLMEDFAAQSLPARSSHMTGDTGAERFVHSRLISSMSRKSRRVKIGM